MRRFGLAPEDFVWASGMEDTFVPQTRSGHRALDEYELMGHYEHWREDLALAARLNVQAFRWGVPWYRVEATPGNFDWRFTDDALSYMVDELKITPVLDLMHYGCPFWLRREFATDEYPEAVARYAAEVARRYRGVVHWYTPFNEPIVTALMCGMRGIWPPYLKGEAGYIHVMTQVARGIVETVEAIKAVDSGAVMVHVEAAGLTRAFRTELEPLAVEDQRRGYLCYDLITGRVTPDHPLFTWLVRHGASVDHLAEMATRSLQLDVVGLNFYPQWSTTQIYVNPKGRVAYRATEQDGDGFATMIEDYYRRYEAPVMITETSAHGDDDVRARWLDRSVEAVRDLRGRGVPVVGYTWFPMCTMVDWKYRTGTRPVDRYHIELGLFSLCDGPDPGTGVRWRETPLVEHWRRLVADPRTAIGPAPPVDGLGHLAKGA